MNNQISGNISISIDHDRIPAFFFFLQKGARMKVEVGCSIKAMLCDQFGVNADYIDNRIKTIFLNGHPVDDVDSTIIDDGSTLALAAAMPGLAGATFRRGGDLASFRSTITHQEGTVPVKRQNGIIVIKLFNLVIRELGPTFLKAGILVSKNQLSDFFTQQSQDFLKACKSVKINGDNSTVDALKHLDTCSDSGNLIVYVTSILQS